MLHGNVLNTVTEERNICVFGLTHGYAVSCACVCMCVHVCMRACVCVGTCVVLCVSWIQNFVIHHIYITLKSDFSSKYKIITK